MKKNHSKLLFQTVLLLINFLFLFQLQAEQTFLLLRADDRSGLLSLKDKVFTQCLSETSYLHASENGLIIYRKTEGANWHIAEIIVKNGRPELSSLDVPAELMASDLFPAFSRDGSKLLWVRYGKGGSTLCIWDRINKKVLRTDEIPGYVFLPSWSSDGKKVAFYLKEKSPVLTKDDYGLAFFDLVEKRLKQYPVSLPTRNSPQRDARPNWSNNSKYVFFEGRYEDVPNQFQLLVDTVSGQCFPCAEGLWINDADLIYLFSADGKKLNVYFNPITDVLNGKINLTDSSGEISIPGFLAFIVDRKTDTLFFQSDNWIVYSFRLKDNKEEMIGKFDFMIRNMSIIRR